MSTKFTDVIKGYEEAAKEAYEYLIANTERGKRYFFEMGDDYLLPITIKRGYQETRQNDEVFPQEFIVVETMQNGDWGGTFSIARESDKRLCLLMAHYLQNVPQSVREV